MLNALVGGDGDASAAPAGKMSLSTHIYTNT